MKHYKKQHEVLASVMQDLTKKLEETLPEYCSTRRNIISDMQDLFKQQYQVALHIAENGGALEEETSPTMGYPAASAKN